MGTMSSQITSHMVVYSAVYSGADQRKQQSSPSLVFAGNSPVTSEFPAQMASNVANVTIWQRHHGNHISFQYMQYEPIPVSQHPSDVRRRFVGWMLIDSDAHGYRLHSSRASSYWNIYLKFWMWECAKNFRRVCRPAQRVLCRIAVPSTTTQTI